MNFRSVALLLITKAVFVFAQQPVFQYQKDFKKPHFQRLDIIQNNWKEYSPLKTDESAAGWREDFTIPGIVGTVYVSATDGTNLYLGGLFNTAGNIVANSVVKWDGQRWSAIGEGAENGVNRKFSSDVPSVEAIAYSQGKLFVGGQFPMAGSTAANGIAYWDGNIWHSIGQDSTNGVRRILTIAGDTTITSGFVYSLFAHQNKIYIGGDFQLAGGKPANGIAAWDIITGEWDTFDGGLSGVNGQEPVYAYAFAARGDEIYVGGKFSSIAGVPAKNIARWNGSAWTSIGQAEGYVTDLGLDSQGNLFALGFYDPDQITGACGLGKWDGNNWSSISGPAGFYSGLLHFRIHNDQVYASGYFEDGHSIPVPTLAKWNGTWQFIEGLGLASSDYLPGSVQTIEFVNDRMFVAGGFTKAGDHFVVNVAEWDEGNARFRKLDSGLPDKGIYDGNILAIEQSGGAAYVGGSFSVAGGVYARNVAKWTGDEWQALGSGYNNGIRGTVYTILADGDDIYVGGHFGSAGTVEAYHIAHWNGVNWSSIGIGVGGVPGAHVNALAKVGDYLYVGGYFSIVGDAANYALEANSIARFNVLTQRWEALGRGIEYVYGIPGIVNDLEVHQDRIYVGGEFHSADDQFFLNFAVLTDNKWSGIGEIGEIGVEGHVRVVKVINDEIYIGGIVQLQRFGVSSGLLKWDVDKWREVGEQLTAAAGEVFVNDIAAYDGGIIIGGYFSYAGNLRLDNLASFATNQWREVGGGVQPGVKEIEILDNKLLISGPAEIFAGGGISVGFAEFDASVTIIGKDDYKAEQFNLQQNYPNPFNPVTTIGYGLPVTTDVSLTIYNILGQQIRTLVLDRQVAGNYTVVWDGRNDLGVPVASGIYLYKLDTGEFVSVKKMYLIR